MPLLKATVLRSMLFRYLSTFPRGTLSICTLPSHDAKAQHAQIPQHIAHIHNQSSPSFLLNHLLPSNPKFFSIKPNLRPRLRPIPQILNERPVRIMFLLLNRGPEFE